MNNELSKLIDMKKSEEEIETNHFIIKDNILRFDHLTLQLSNISRIYAGTKRMNSCDGDKHFCFSFWNYSV